jgi:ligand-binding sensor domain-containing protein
MKIISWRRLITGALVSVGVAAFVAVGQVINSWQSPPNPLPGWQIIRPPHWVSALAEQGDVVWAGGRDGVFALDRSTGVLVEELALDVPLRYVRALLVDEAGVLWVGHHAGLTRYDSSASRTYTEEDGLPDNRVNALLRDRDGRLWVGTWGGAAVLDGERWQVLTANDGLADNMVNAMLQDHQGGMWFGSYVAPHGGISYLSGEEWSYFTTENGLPHNNVTSLLEDRDGSVWAGTGLLDRGGACRFTRTATGWTITQVYRREEGLAGEKVRSIFQESAGVFWFGSEYDGVARFDGDCWRVLTRADGLAAPEVMAILQDAEGDLWLGTADGLTRIRANVLGTITCGSRS